jgi:hypothetical protein
MKPNAERVAARHAARQLGKSLPETGYDLRRVTIYRAVPVSVDSFKPMDYVGRNLRWVKGHADHVAAVSEEEAVVLKATVMAADVYEAYNPGEFFYNGPEVKGRIVYRQKYGSRTAKRTWPKGIYLHGSKRKFDRFKVGPHGLIYLSNPNDPRVRGKTQAEHIADGPFGNYLAEVKFNESGAKWFRPWMDEQAADVVRQVVRDAGHSVSDSKLESMIGGVIHYEWAPEIVPLAKPLGYNTFKFYEPAVHGSSIAVADPSLLKITSWEDRD